VYDCDSRAKQLTASDSTILKELEGIAGRTLMKEGSLDRKALADFMFADPENVRRVNAVVHPAVRSDYRRWCEAQHSCIAVMESAILFESGFDADVDIAVTVDAPEDLRLERAARRDGVNREAVRLREERQMPQQEKVQRARFVIVNDGQQSLDDQIDRLLVTIVRILLEKEK